MNAHFSKPKDPIFFNGFFATLQLACNFSNVYEGAALWAQQRYVKEALANALNSCMCGDNCLLLLATFVRSGQYRFYKLLCLYPETVSNLSKKYAFSQVISEYDATILFHTHLVNNTLQNYADLLAIKSYKVSDV